MLCYVMASIIDLKTDYENVISSNFIQHKKILRYHILRKKLARLNNKAPYLLCLPIQMACGSSVDPVNSRTRSDWARTAETGRRTAKSVREIGPLMLTLFFCNCSSFVVHGLCSIGTFMGVNRNCKTPMPQPYDIAQEVVRVVASICAFFMKMYSWKALDSKTPLHDSTSWPCSR